MKKRKNEEYEEIVSEASFCNKDPITREEITVTSLQTPSRSSSPCKPPDLANDNHLSSDILQLNHDAAKHKMAVKPSKRRTPSRLGVLSKPCHETAIEDEESKKTASCLVRSTSLSSLASFEEIQKTNLLLSKSVSKILLLMPSSPSTSMTGQVDDANANIIMLTRTLPTRWSGEDSHDKFKLSIANWYLANEGLRKSIQSLQPGPMIMRSATSLSCCESLASICSGLQQLDNDNDMAKADIVEADSDDDEEEKDKDDTESSEDDLATKIDTENDDNVEEETSEDCLMNVNVKERRKSFLQMLEKQKTQDQLSSPGLESKNKLASLVIMGSPKIVHDGDKMTSHHPGLSNVAKVEKSSETVNKVKLMVSRFNANAVVSA